MFVVKKLLSLSVYTALQTIENIKIFDILVWLVYLRLFFLQAARSETHEYKSKLDRQEEHCSEVTLSLFKLQETMEEKDKVFLWQIQGPFDQWS